MKSIKMKRIAIVTSIFAALMVTSCKHDLPVAISDLNGGGTGPIDTTIIIPPVDTVICFESQILPLFVSSCAKSGCHDAITAEKDLVLTNYQAIMEGINANDLSDSEFLQVMLLPQSNEDAMPPAPNLPMTQEQIALITQWINQGAQNTTNCANTCDTTLFQYTAHIKPIMSTYCNGCHQGTSPSAGVNTSTHAGLNTIAENGKLVGTINHLNGFSFMPQNQPKIDICFRTKIQKWVLAGSPNN